MHRFCTPLIGVIAALASAAGCRTNPPDGAIDREELVGRHDPHIVALDTLASLTVGDGNFACTVDITGLQSFPETYRRGVPLGTQSSSGWAWHSFPNEKGYTRSEALIDFDFGRGHTESYSLPARSGRGREAGNYFRINPHRLHLGTVGFDGLTPAAISATDQRLDLWSGIIHSHFTTGGFPVHVETACDSGTLACRICSETRLAIRLRYPYPTGAHSDDGCDWTRPERHRTERLAQGDGWAVLRRTIDTTVYDVLVAWEGRATLAERGAHDWVLRPGEAAWSFTVQYLPPDAWQHREPRDAGAVIAASKRHWEAFWKESGAVDFSRCTDPRAAELERRVVLSQYLLRAQCAGETPPQESGLTYNSWFGKFHLEMTWWHQAHFALWGSEQLLKQTLAWYRTAWPVAREIARRQGFDGVRWMKMTDPSGEEGPSDVGSFLIWQQPHPIYLAELCYRAGLAEKEAGGSPDGERPEEAVLRAWSDLVEESAAFMASFATRDAEKERYLLRGFIPAQETLRPAETVNAPFELAYWYFGLSTAQKWRERTGRERHPEWDAILEELSPLAAADGLYLAAESAPDTYREERFTSDHMAVLGAAGVVPLTPLVDPDTMRRTLDWVMAHWNWERTWGWDYPMTAMAATRLGRPEQAVEALLMPNRTNTYLPNGHNFQDERLRCYLPGNGGLLTAVALMCAGWDGCETKNPGFPKDGTWEVRWEGVRPLL